MGEPTVAEPLRGEMRDAPGAKAPAKLTFGRRAVLFMGIAVLGGAPAYISVRGDLRGQHANSGTPAVMNATADAAKGGSTACKVPGANDDFKPTMSLKPKGHE